ncbi:MAG: helix-turn-helix transcriptional regulator [Candidatus Omnitrophota bacterium]
MHENIFWDKKITESEAKSILKDESHPRFVEVASLLLSRSNDMKLVFNTYFDKAAFCRNWRRIKRLMRKDKWNDPRIDFWDQVYQVVKESVEMPERPIKEKEVVTTEITAIGIVIRKARKKKKWTQKDLSTNAHISQQMISYIEKGYPNFSIDTLTKIAGVLGLKISIKQKISYSPPSHGSLTSTSGEAIDF